jgi:hypothetical protein
MRENEGPWMPYTLMYERKLHPFRFVAYDNGCTLDAYKWNRAAYHFKDSLTFIDAFHQPTHVGCCEGYKLAAFDRLQKCTHLNSQVAEEGNSVLRRIMTTASFMTVPNFMAFINLFAYGFNLRKAQKYAAPTEKAAIDAINSLYKDLVSVPATNFAAPTFGN